MNKDEFEKHVKDNGLEGFYKKREAKPDPAIVFQYDVDEVKREIEKAFEQLKDK